MRILLVLVVLSGCGGGPECAEDAGPVAGEWRLAFDSLEGECWAFKEQLYAMYPSGVDFGAFEVSGLLEGSCGSEYDGAPSSSLNKQYGTGDTAPWSVVFSETHAAPGEITARFDASEGLAGPCSGNVTAVKVSAPPL